MSDGSCLVTRVGEVLEIGAGTGSNLAHYGPTESSH